MNAPDFQELPHEVISLLDWWMPRVKAAFEGESLSIYLFGGLVFGEFAPGWSDVDTCVIVRTAVTEAQANAMRTILAEMDTCFVQQHAEGWRSGQAVQGAVITAAQAAEPGKAEPCFYAWGPRGAYDLIDPFSAFDRYLLAKHGRLLKGSQMPIAPPSEQALLDMATNDLKSFRDEIVAVGQRTPIGLAGWLHWAARSLVFWREDMMLPKSAALRHEIERDGPFAGAFRLALEVRETGVARAASYEAQLRQHLRDAGPGIHAELGALLARHAKRIAAS